MPLNPLLAHPHLRAYAVIKQTNHYQAIKWCFTPDCWYPCWGGVCSSLDREVEHGEGLVWVSLHKPYTDKAGRTTTRVSVWGADDSGVDRDFEDAALARAVYAGMPRSITREYLQSLGFTQA